MSVTINSTTLDFTKLYFKGAGNISAVKDEEEKTKQGTLRAGNSGIHLDNGIIAASCPRQAMLRSRGINISPPPSKSPMFELGLANEDAWYQNLSAVWTQGQILREHETPISWTTTNGTQVTGRPDMVLCGSNNTPLVGLELKSVSSFWTIKNLQIENTPSIAHVAQAAHYMWQLNIPFVLVYTNRVNHTFPWKYVEAFRGKSYVFHTESQHPLHIEPFILAFPLEIRDGVVWFNSPTGWVETIVTVDGIRQFYETASTIAETGQLPSRPTDKGVRGESTYSPCKYCPFLPVCDQYETHSLDTWLDAAFVAAQDITLNEGVSDEC